ncbi:MAG: GTPase [Candidatus Diapherotrites archaeon]
MPSNVSFEYTKAQGKYEQASTNSEKLAALQEMRSTAPKHKGAEKLRAEISGKLARLKRDMEKQREQAKKTSGGKSLNVRKEGAGQVVLVGMPNSGKSTLLNALTGLDVEVEDYPFTTKKPEIGMMNYHGADVQLVEVPAIIRGSSSGKANGTQLLSVIRNADAVVLVVRSKNEEKTLLNELSKADIILNRKKPAIEVKQAKFPGITIAGKQHLKIKEAELIGFLKSAGIHSASVILGERTTINKIAEVLDTRIVYRHALTVNMFEGIDAEMLKEKIFALLGRVIVFTKKPGQEAVKDKPLVLPKGSTVEDVAKNLHKDFTRKLKYVRVWGATKFAGQRVSRTYVLNDGDIIEIYS